MALPTAPPPHRTYSRSHLATPSPNMAGWRHTCAAVAATAAPLHPRTPYRPPHRVPHAQC
eukprot:973896-Prymnesium_polylepis.1